MAGRNGTLLTRSGALGFVGLWPQTHKCALGLTLNFHTISQTPRCRNAEAHIKRQRVRGVWRNESIQLGPRSASGGGGIGSTPTPSPVGVEGEAFRVFPRRPSPARNVCTT